MIIDKLDLEYGIGRVDCTDIEELTELFEEQIKNTPSEYVEE